MERRPFRIEDGNESVCGACLKSGTLICCENCPAAFHPECAGYCSIDNVPEGDWYCFLCSRKLGLPFETGSTFRGEAGRDAMVAYDKHNEVFERVLITEVGPERLTVRRRGKNETVAIADGRLWRGTMAEEAWTLTPDGKYRPNSRAFEIDYQQIAAMEDSTEKAPPNLREGGYAHYLHLRKRDPKEQHFVELLKHFWRVHKKREEIQWPSFGYIVSLSDLWDGVQKRGGFVAVTEGSLWDEVATEIAQGNEVRKFGFVLKHMYQTVLLEVEQQGGVEALEEMKERPPVPQKREAASEERLLHDVGLRKRRRRSLKKRRVPLGDDWTPLPVGPPEEVQNTVAMTTTSPVLPQKWPQTFTASRAVQEYRNAIGIVALTDVARTLSTGDRVDVRMYRDSSLGPWRAARILNIATASAFEGYRRFRVKFSKSKDPEQFPTLAEEWVTLLARPSAWGTTLSEPAVLVRPLVKPYFPPVKATAAQSHREGDRVEAWLHNGWWPATIISIQDQQAVLQGDVIPLGEGLKLISSLSYIRPMPPSEESGFGMIEPLEMSEEIYPKEMEKRLNVMVDKTPDGHLVLSFKRLDRKPSDKY